MKKIILILICLIFTGCSTQSAQKETYFYATIDTLKQDECLVKADGDDIFQSQELVNISSYFQDGTHQINDFCVGEKIYIGFNGVIQETSPIQLPQVNSIEKMKSQDYMNAIVQEVREKEIVVKPCLDEDHHANQKIMEAPQVLMNSEVISTTKLPSLKQGDKIRIVFNDMKLEENPLKIMNVFVIYLLDDNGDIIVP